jgi:hypothetical protein
MNSFSHVNEARIVNAGRRHRSLYSLKHESLYRIRKEELYRIIVQPPPSFFILNTPFFLTITIMIVETPEISLFQ